MIFSVQMFGMNRIFLQDKEKFVGQLAEAGYNAMEPRLMLQAEPDLVGFAWTPEDFAENAPLLQRNGLGLHSVHVFTRDLQGELPQLIRVAKEYGIRQLVIPCPGFENEAQYEAQAEYLTAAGQTLVQEGLQLLLHCGKDEIAAKIGDLSAYEWLLRRCGGSVGAQVDLGWVLCGGEEPVALLERNRAYVRSIHYKDMEQTPQGLQETGVGRGLLDMQACFRYARELDIPQILDQNSSLGDIMADMQFVGAIFARLQGRA